jgi:hypothetical protein
MLGMASGDGSDAWIMKGLGWSTDHMLCIDIARPNPPILPEVPYLYVDLNAFGRELQKGSHAEIPSQLIPHKQRFNIAIAAFPEVDRTNLDLSASFFLDSGSKLIVL